MSTSLVEVSDNLRIDNCLLFAIHSPLIFLVDVTSTTPYDYTLVSFTVNGVTNGEYYRTLPYKDITATTRRFWFDASKILRSLMPSLDDTLINEDEIAEDGVTSVILRFYDNTTTYSPPWPIYFNAQAAAVQFGESPSLYRLFFNDSDYAASIAVNEIAKPNIDVFYAGKNDYCYVYYYDDSNLVITYEVDDQFVAMLDFDDVEFLDFDDEILLTL